MADKKKKISIVYDLDHKPIDVAIDSSLNLIQTARELRKELNRTQEGTDEFKLLSKRLNETRDDMERVKAKSGEFFNTLSLLPGPVGEFGGKIDGALQLLKTFSGFKLSDVTNQLKELGKDAKEVVLNILQLNVAEKAETATSAENVAVKEEQAIANKANTAALEGETVATEAAEVATISFGAALKAIGIGLIIAALAALVVYWDKIVDAVTGATNVTKTYEEAQKQVGKEVADFEIKLKDVTNAFAAAKAGTMSKEDALKKYNETLGATVGYAGNLKQAEELMAANTAVVIESIKLRAQAQIFYGKAAEASAKLVSGEGLEPTFWEKTWNIIKAGGSIIGGLQNNVKTYVDNIKENQGIVDKFNKEGDRLTKNAIENDKNLKKGLAKPPEQVDLAAAHKDAINRLYDEKVAQFNLEESKKKVSANEVLRLLHENKVKADLYKLEQDRQKALLNQLEADHKAKLVKDEDYKNQKAAINVKIKDNEAKHNEDVKAGKENVRKALEQNNKLIAQSAEMMNDQVTKSMKDSLDKQIQTIKDAGEKQKKAFKDIQDELLRQGLITQETYNKNTQTFNAKVAEDVKNQSQKATQTDFLDKFDKKYSDFFTHVGEGFSSTNAFLKKEQEDLEKAFKNGTISEEEYNKRHKDILADMKNNWQNVANALDFAANAAGNMAQMFDKDTAAAIILTKAQQALAFSSTLAALAGMYQGLGESAKLPFPGNVIAIVSFVATLGTALAQLNSLLGPLPKPESSNSSGGTTKEQNYGKAYGYGGVITGPKHAAGGTLINAEGGESIINANSTRMFLPLLSTLNQVGGGTAFNSGALGQANVDMPQVMSSDNTIIKTYVVEHELTSLQERQARLKNLSTL